MIIGTGVGRGVAHMLGWGVAAAVGACYAAESEAQEVFRDCEACPKMVVVPPGSFVMGSPEWEEGRYGDEGPRHEVTIGYPFAVGIYEVTFAEWDACVSAGGCVYRPDDQGWGRGSRPAINASWEDAQAYVEWLSGQTGQEYRLLSEAEWEYAARAGTRTETYWSDRQCRYANGADLDLALRLRELGGERDPGVASCLDGYWMPAPVGSFEPNAFGLYDVLGNVLEWTEDCWHEDYTGAPADGSPWTSGDCNARVLRGGSWFYLPVQVR